MAKTLVPSTAYILSVHVNTPHGVYSAVYASVYSFTKNRSLILSKVSLVELHLFPFSRCWFSRLLGSKTYRKPQTSVDTNVLNPIDKQVWLKPSCELEVSLPSPGWPQISFSWGLDPLDSSLFTHTLTAYTLQGFNAFKQQGLISICMEYRSHTWVYRRWSGWLRPLSPVTLHWSSAASDRMFTVSSCPAAPCMPFCTHASTCPSFTNGVVKRLYHVLFLSLIVEDLWEGRFDQRSTVRLRTKPTATCTQ